MIELGHRAARLRAGLGKCLLLLSLSALSACASFDGQPRAVLTPTAAAVPNAYVPQTALVAYGNKTTADERRTYRNTVIGIYMVASDANFLEFRRMLSRQSKGSNFALGSGSTALTTAATVAAERTANILSAFASGLSGIQGRLSSEVYFERTLPALLAGMEAQRTRFRTNIVSRLGQGDEYSLTEALLDLSSYEAAGSLDGAIETITNQASELREQEQARFENVVGLGRVVAAPQRIELRTLGNRIDALVVDANRRADLDKIATHLDVRINPVAALEGRQIMTKLRDMAASDPASLGRFVTEMRAQGVELGQ